MCQLTHIHWTSDGSKSCSLYASSSCERCAKVFIFHLSHVHCYFMSVNRFFHFTQWVCNIIMFCKCVKRTKKSYKNFQKEKLCSSCLLQHSFTLNCLVFRLKFWNCSSDGTQISSCWNCCFGKYNKKAGVWYCIVKNFVYLRLQW